jgi:hypothetical protein
MIQWFLTKLCPLGKFSVSIHYHPNSITHSTQIEHIDMSKNWTHQVWIWSLVDDFWQSYAPFTLKIMWNFRFPYQYDPNSIRHSNQIWHFDTSKEWACQVRIWSLFDDFWQSYVPFTLKIIWNFQFPFIIAQTVLQIQLKFEIWICLRNVQVKIKFGHGSMIFGRVMPL